MHIWASVWLTVHVYTHTRAHNSHCRTTSGFIIFFSLFLLSFSWEQGGWGGAQRWVSHSLSFVAAGERAHIHTERSLQPHSHPHTAPSLFSSPHTHIHKDTTSKSRQHWRITSATHWLLNPGLFLLWNPPLAWPHLVQSKHSCQVAFTHGGEACLKQLLTSYKQDDLPFPLYPFFLSLSLSLSPLRPRSAFSATHPHSLHFFHPLLFPPLSFLLLPPSLSLSLWECWGPTSINCQLFLGVLSMAP